MTTATRTRWTWRGLLRLLLPNPTPYWRRRLEDEQEPTGAEWFLEAVAFPVGMLLVAGVILSAGLWLALAAFVVPGGLPSVIAHQLADVCRATGNCDLGYLLAGYAMGWNMVVAVVLLLLFTLWRVVNLQRGTQSQHDLAYVDARIVELREELMGAGILTKRPDEAEPIEPAATGGKGMQ